MFSTCSELTPCAPIPDEDGTIYAALAVSNIRCESVTAEKYSNVTKSLTCETENMKLLPLIGDSIKNFFCLESSTVIA